MIETPNHVHVTHKRHEPEGKPVQPHRGRAYRRQLEQSQARASRRRRRAGDQTNGSVRLDRWRREAWVSLVRQAARLGVPELDGVQDRKALVIALQREQAAIAGVSNATWACATRKQRGALVALGRTYV
jgi:hypothetical protein